MPYPFEAGTPKTETRERREHQTELVTTYLLMSKSQTLETPEVL